MSKTEDSQKRWIVNHAKPKTMDSKKCRMSKILDSQKQWIVIDKMPKSLDTEKEWRVNIGKMNGQQIGMQAKNGEYPKTMDR